jgi:hypothetical protein
MALGKGTRRNRASQARKGSMAQRMRRERGEVADYHGGAPTVVSAHAVTLGGGGARRKRGHGRTRGTTLTVDAQSEERTDAEGNQEHGECEDGEEGEAPVCAQHAAVEAECLEEHEEKEQAGLLKGEGEEQRRGRVWRDEVKEQLWCGGGGGASVCCGCASTPRRRGGRGQRAQRHLGGRERGAVVVVD